jgi:hypothetical protein
MMIASQESVILLAGYCLVKGANLPRSSGLFIWPDTTYNAGDDFNSPTGEAIGNDDLACVHGLGANGMCFRLRATRSGGFMRGGLCFLY